MILTDFDIAGRVHAQGYREENGSKIVDGTPDYIAPEQVRGEPIQPQSDQYALAALVYQMVTGGTVFRGTQQDVLNAHLSLMPESFEARMKGCVSPLAQAIEPCLVKALAKHPSQRYDSVADFIQAMQEAVAEQSQRARYAEPILQYGLLAAMRGNAVEAHEYFTYAIETDPTNITACYMDAIALGQLGATNDAQARYAEVQELVPRSPDEMVMKGHAATATGHTVKAIGYYRKALELGGGNVSELESRIADLQNQIRAAVGETTVRGVTGRLRSFLRGFGRRTDTRRADPGLVYG